MIVAVWLSLFLVFCAPSLRVADVLAVAIGALAVAVAGFVDDVKGLRARSRFAVHVLAAVLLAFWPLNAMISLNSGFWIWNLGILVPLLAGFLAVWSINLFNFMDGMDGLAGAEAVWVFGVGGWLLWRAGGEPMALAAWILAAAAAGFLVWNRPSARVFMGDVCSGFLGFLVAAFAFIGEYRYGVPALAWGILYGLFVVDASLTLLRRILRGERWYSAHRMHAYQRLHHQGGLSHLSVLAYANGVNAFLAVLAVWGASDRRYLGIAAVVAFIGLILLFGVIERRAPMPITASA